MRVRKQESGRIRELFKFVKALVAADTFDYEFGVRPGRDRSIHVSYSSIARKRDGTSDQG